MSAIDCVGTLVRFERTAHGLGILKKEHGGDIERNIRIANDKVILMGYHKNLM
jgi:hypothetical protein